MDALHLVQKLVEEGLAFEQIERLLELQYGGTFAIMELKFLQDCRLRSSRGIQENRRQVLVSFIFKSHISSSIQ